MSPLRILVFVLVAACAEGRAAEKDGLQQADATVLPSVGGESTSEAEELNNSTVPPLLPYIVGGNPASLGQFPYQAQLLIYTSEGTLICGGSIIREDYILTAAHCVAGSSAGNVAVLAGTITLGDGGTTIGGYKIIVHEDYTGTGSLLNDIALVLLNSNLTYNNNIKPIDLEGTTVASGTPCTISGWGTTVNDGDASETLRYAQVPFIPTDSCAPEPGASVRRGQICAGYTEGGIDSCQGDSGGPLVCNNVLSGIVSWGNKCALPYNPGVYTDVLFYKSWIESNMKPKSAASLTKPCLLLGVFMIIVQFCTKM